MPLADEQFGNFELESIAGPLTALGGGGQNGATPLTAMLNLVGTVAARGDSVLLPAGLGGFRICVVNTGANAVAVFPGTGDAINGQAANASVLQMPNSIDWYANPVAGQWYAEVGDGFAGSDSVFNPGGSGASGARAGGNLQVSASAAGLGNAADTTDDVLFTYPLPANALDIAGRQVTIVAAGKTAANGNNKRVKIWWGTTTQTVGAAVAGGTLIADSAVQTTNNGGWQASVQVTKYGAAGSNTQIGSNAQIVMGAAHLGTAVPVLLTAAENAVINITVTGASPTTGAANDVLGQLFDVSFNN